MTLQPGQFSTIYQQKRRIFFYERPDGSIFDIDEGNAWKIHSKFKQIGVSDGSKHAEMLKEIEKNAKTLTPEQVNAMLHQALEAEIEAARGNFATPRDLSVETFGNEKLKRFLEHNG